ncbi:hypothetical protein CPB84DRAFT_1749111 [Gymnopilus junonius]|uniref:Uncharacterized protein n=1 Tax=Gymnopilus junonius TaxID=109634 RepID=A0A9P5TLN6_GYMJU|nr:hypothetical protein CPB84DRAFT_1749111 [Gymnopilus junonius]
MTDQPGKDGDSEVGQQTTPLRRLYDDTIPPRKILISVPDNEQKEHHLVVPIPNSYDAALAIAFDQLGEYFLKEAKLLLEAAYLEYGMKSIDGSPVWAKLPPEFWKEIVKDGDHLKLCVKPAVDSDEASIERPIWSSRGLPVSRRSRGRWATRGGRYIGD